MNLHASLYCLGSRSRKRVSCRSPRQFAEILVAEGPLPRKAALDALHIAVAVSGGIEYLLTWNFAHLANATIRNQIERKCRAKGYEPPIICTSEELLRE